MHRFYNHDDLNLESALDRISQLESEMGLGFEALPELGLTGHEEALLGMLLKERYVLTREKAHTAFYGMNSDPPHPKAFDVFVTRLRAKLSKYGISFQTVWGRGWYMPEDQKARVRELTKPQDIGQ